MCSALLETTRGTLFQLILLRWTLGNFGTANTHPFPRISLGEICLALQSWKWSDVFSATRYVSRFWSTCKFSQNWIQRGWFWLEMTKSRWLFLFEAPHAISVLCIQLASSLVAYVAAKFASKVCQGFCLIIMQKLCLILWKIFVDIFNTFSFWNFSSSLLLMLQLSLQFVFCCCAAILFFILV